MKYNSAAIIRPNVPIRVKIHILVICGLIRFQSSLLPTKLDIDTKAPINIPTEITPNITTPIIPLPAEAIFEPRVPPVSALVGDLELAFEDILL
jgi:hypothetical protein